MGYEIYFQGFVDGDASGRGGDVVRAILEPHASTTDADGGFLRIELPDGGSDVHLSDGSMMVTHTGGAATWDLLVRAAREADWSVLLLDAPPAITHEQQRAHLPPELADPVLVTTGADLLRLITDT